MSARQHRVAAAGADAIIRCMKLTVLAGPGGSGKAARTTDRFVAACRAGHPAFLLVPTGLDRARMLRALAQEHGTVVGGEVGTHARLVDAVAGMPGVRRSDVASELVIVRDALAHVPALARAARHAGFAQTARRHVGRLRRTAVWSGAEHDAAIASLPGGDRDDWLALADAVGELLAERSLADDACMEQLARQQLDAGARMSVHAHGFDDLPEAELSLLLAIARRGTVTVALDWVPGRVVHERRSRLIDRLVTAGGQLEHLPPGAPSAALLGWLGEELFEPTTHADDAPTRSDASLTPVEFVDCCGPLQEAEEVVREVVRLMAGGVPGEAVAVVSARPERLHGLLAAEFTRAGLPVAFQVARTARDVPAGRAVHDLVDAALRDDPLALVAACRARVLALDPTKVDGLELALRAEVAARRGGDSATRGRDWRSLGPVADALPAAVLDLVDAARGRGEPVHAVRRLLRSLRPTDEGDLRLILAIGRTVEHCVAAAGGEAGIGLRDVRAAVASLPLELPDRWAPGCVLVSSLARMRGRRFDAVVMHGLDEAGCSATVDDDADAPAAARDLVHAGVVATRQTLRVVRQSCDGAGDPRAPHAAWLELARLLPDAPRRERRLGHVLPAPDEVLFEAEQLAAVARARAAGDTVTGVPSGVEQTLARHAPRRRRSTVAGAAGIAMRDIRSIGARDVGTYATCSARWYIARILKAAEPDADMRTRVIGRVVHGALELLAPQLHGGGLDQASASLRVRRAVDAARTTHDPGCLLDDAACARITGDVEALVVAEIGCGLTPPDEVLAELPFGGSRPGALPPLQISGVDVTGRIDRMDRYGSQVLLHDYKTSASAKSPATLLAESDLQLFLYWLALAAHGTYEPVGALLRPVRRDANRRGLVTETALAWGWSSVGGATDPEDVDRLLGQAREVAEEAIASLRAAHVEPLPRRSACPSWCSFQAVCRVGEDVA